MGHQSTFRCMLTAKYSVSHSIVLAVWRTGNTMVSMNEVPLHWAQSALAWVTISREESHLGIQPAGHPGQLSLAMRSWVGTIS